ncbi:QueT transporter family protein [Candidatus Bathyarchaeota archaeon]|nr:QueT transporter family protein [Candidatus Bathyarchaeota archaeon]MBS7627874.1 QueT transporter family protein [Candidatus Bathyarchaeota archaeon]
MKTERGEKVDRKALGLLMIFASLYALLTITFAPISFGPLQLRLADCLISLAALFGWPLILGVTLGCFVGNAYTNLFYFWMGPYDILLGPLANLVAASIIFLLRKRRLMACIIGSIPVGFIVGGYLWIFFPPPDIFGLILPAWTSMVLSLTISSLIAIGGLGYGLLKTLSKESILKPLISRGLRVYTDSSDGKEG